MEEKKPTNNEGKQTIDDAKSSTEGKITTDEVVKTAEEIKKLRDETKTAVKKLINEYSTKTNATFQDIREFYGELGREVEDVFFDFRIQAVVNELDKRYALKNE